MIDSAKALAAAARLRSHLPPYAGVPSADEADNADQAVAQKPQEAGAD